MRKKLLFSALLLGNLFLTQAQNDCASALVVAPGVSTVGFIDGTFVDACNASAGSAAEWYVYTSAISGLVTVTSNLPQNDGTTLSDDTYLNVYKGTCGALVCFDSNDDSGGTFLSTSSFTVAPGDTFYFEWVDEWSDLGFDFTLTETVVTCPGTIVAPFTENFTNANEILVCWDFIDSDGDGINWTVIDYDIDLDGIADGNPCLKSASYDNDTFSPLTPDNWIISNLVDLSAFSNGTALQLTWEARGIDADYSDENYAVYVATTNTVADLSASPTTFTEIIGQNGGNGVFAAKSLDISSFAGQNIFIAFRHFNCSNEFELNIDNVGVSTNLNSQAFSKNNVSIYPNPSSGLVNVATANGVINSVKIVDINGRTVKSETINQLSTVEINVSNLQTGMYLITINTDLGSVTQKIMKQ